MDSKHSNIWEDRLAQYEASGSSITAWCKEQAIRENQFYYWRKKLRAGQPEKTQSVQWLPLELQPTKQARLAADPISVHIGRTIIEIRKGFNQQLLREIVQVLQTI
jgi:transposase-like protein